MTSLESKIQTKDVFYRFSQGDLVSKALATIYLGKNKQYTRYLYLPVALSNLMLFKEMEDIIVDDAENKDRKSVVIELFPNDDLDKSDIVRIKDYDIIIATMYGDVEDLSAYKTTKDFLRLFAVYTYLDVRSIIVRNAIGKHLYKSKLVTNQDFVGENSAQVFNMLRYFNTLYGSIFYAIYKGKNIDVTNYDITDIYSEVKLVDKLPSNVAYIELPGVSTRYNVFLSSSQTEKYNTELQHIIKKYISETFTESYIKVILAFISMARESNLVKK